MMLHAALLPDTLTFITCSTNNKGERLIQHLFQSHAFVYHCMKAALELRSALCGNLSASVDCCTLCSNLVPVAECNKLVNSSLNAAFHTYGTMFICFDVADMQHWVLKG